MVISTIIIVIFSYTSAYTIYLYKLRRNNTDSIWYSLVKSASVLDCDHIVYLFLRH